MSTLSWRNYRQNRAALDKWNAGVQPRLNIRGRMRVRVKTCRQAVSAEAPQFILPLSLVELFGNGCVVVAPAASKVNLHATTILISWNCELRLVDYSNFIARYDFYLLRKHGIEKTVEIITTTKSQQTS